MYIPYKDEFVYFLWMIVGIKLLQYSDSVGYIDILGYTCNTSKMSMSSICKKITLKLMHPMIKILDIKF